MKRKTLITLISIFTIVFSVISIPITKVKATDEENIDNESTKEIPLQTIVEEQSLEYQATDEESFKEENDKAYEQAKNKEKARTASFQLGPYQGLTYYSQIDNRWKNHPYTVTGSSNQTIGISGCGPTASAMVVSSIKGNITPPEMGDLYVRNGFRSTNNGTYWSAFKWTAEQFGIGYEETYSLDTAINLVRNNYYVIASVSEGLFTSGGHFVVIVGVDGDTLKIFDPYLYSGKFEIPSRVGKVRVEGNTVFCSISNFRNYANYKGFFAFKNDNQDNNQGTGNVEMPQYTRYVKTSTGVGVNVRSGPGINYSKITAYPDGTKVVVYQMNGNWAKVGINAWVDADYLVEIYNSEIADYPFSPYNVIITSNIGLNIRRGTSTSYEKIGAYPKGSIVKIIAQSNGWGMTDKGWIDLTYTSRSNNVTTSTVGQVKYLKQRTTLYQNPNLTGTQYQYLPNTSVVVLENVSPGIDKVRVRETGRVAYVRTSNFR